MTTLLVACTKTKRQRPTPEMRMRARRPDTVGQLADAWLADAADQPSYRPDDLYGGQGWQDVRRATSRWDARLLIASAGFGLLEPDARIPAYDATFAPGEDRVARSILGGGSPDDRHRAWYQAVNSRRLPEGRIVAALGRDYVHALQSDLEPVADPDRLLLLTFGPPLSETLEACRLPVGSELRNLLGVPMSRLGTHTLIWLATFIAPRSGWDFAALRAEVALLEIDRQEPQLMRRKADDQEVSCWIQAKLRSNASVSTGALLARFRREGVACEQTRFAGLVRKVRAQMGL